VPGKSLREGANIGENVLVYKTALKLTPLMEILEKIRSDSTGKEHKKKAANDICSRPSNLLFNSDKLKG